MEKGVELVTIIEKVLKNKDYPYLVIRLNIDVVTPALETILLKNNFFPTSFLPYFNHGKDVIEYQYISSEKLTIISELLANRDLILQYKEN